MHILRGFQRSCFLANPCDVLHYAILYHNEEANQGNLPRIVEFVMSECTVLFQVVHPAEHFEGISCITHTSVTRGTGTTTDQALHICSFEQFFPRHSEFCIGTVIQSCELKTKGQ